MPDIAPADQAKALKRLAMIMVLTGLMIGVGLPMSGGNATRSIRWLAH